MSHASLGFKPVPFALAAALLAGCGSTVATSSFKGEEHAIAQTIANLQAHVTAGEQDKICAKDLAAATVARLGQQSGCEAAVKTQLSEIDNTELALESVTLAPSGTTASAVVKSTYSGKSVAHTISLQRTANNWKISGVR